MSSRLKMLMKIFEISNHDLSLLLCVDVSLVSKWRSGSRNINSNPEYVNGLVSYIMGRDKRNGYKKVRELLSQEYDMAKTCSEEKLPLFLADWLCNSEGEEEREGILANMLKSKELTRIEQMYYWEGNEGRREAVKYFTQYATACAPGAEIISYTTESNRWFHEDPQFLKLWMKLILEFFEKGNVMKIVHPMNRNYSDTVMSMAKWLPLHMTCEVRGYYLKKYDEKEAIKLTILVLKGKMALFSVSKDRESVECKTWSVHNSLLVKEIEKVARQYLKDSVPLFKRYTLETGAMEKDFLNDMLSIYEADSTCYFYDDFNHMLPISEEKRRKIFESAGLETAEIEKVVTVLKTIDSLKENCECYFLIDTEILYQWLCQDVIKANILSLFANKTLYVPGALYMEAVLDFLDSLLLYDNFHIGLIDREIHNDLGQLSFCSGGKNIHTFVTTYDTEHTISLEISEYTVATALYQKMEAVWQATPYLRKDKEYVVDYIKKEIKEISNR